MYYLLRYYKEPDKAGGTILQKNVLETVVKKILHKYTYKDFLKISF